MVRVTGAGWLKGAGAGGLEGTGTGGLEGAMYIYGEGLFSSGASPSPSTAGSGEPKHEAR